FVWGGGRSLERISGTRPIHAATGPAQPQPHVGPPRKLLCELGERDNHLMIQPRVFGGVGPEGEAEGRRGDACQDLARVLPRVERAPTGQGELRCASFALNAPRENLHATKETGEPFHQTRHGWSAR